jgi:hypothetical protein
MADDEQDTGAVGVGGKDTVEELREQWEEEDAAGQPVGEDEMSLAVQPPASDIEEDLSSEDDEGVRLYPEESEEELTVEESPVERLMEPGGKKKDKKIKKGKKDKRDEPESHVEYILVNTRTRETQEISEFAFNTLSTIRAVVPPRAAFYLGVGALIVIEVVEPPVAAAIGLGYEALRRWIPGEGKRIDSIETP